MTPEEMRASLKAISAAVQSVDDDEARTFNDPKDALRMIGLADVILNRFVIYAGDDPRGKKIAAVQKELASVKDTLSLHLIG